MNIVETLFHIKEGDAYCYTISEVSDKDIENLIAWGNDTLGNRMYITKINRKIYNRNEERFEPIDIFYQAVVNNESDATLFRLRWADEKFEMEEQVTRNIKGVENVDTY